MSDIDAFKARFLRLLELREAHDIADVQEKKTNAAYREYEAELYEALKDAGIEGTQKFDFGLGVGTASFRARKPTFYGQVIDKDVAISALKREGLSDAIMQDVIRKGRLNELVRDRLESGGELPEGVGYYDQKGISISRK